MSLIIRKLGWQLPRLLMIAVIAVTCTATGTAMADTTWTQTSQADFETGTLYQLDTSTSPGDVRLAITESNYIYALQGNRKYGFWVYDVAADSWTSLHNTPAKVKWGGALAHDGGNYIYALRGYDSRDFWRYDIAADVWLTMPDTPANVAWGGALTYHDGYVYALRGNYTKDFWRYDVTAGSWQSLADAGDFVVGGGALTNDGGNYVYSFQCMDTETLWRYDIAADTWLLMADSPNNIGNGAALTYDGSDAVYALRGRYSTDFWRYNISADSWTVLTGTPISVEWGGALAYDGSGSVYVLRGANSKFFWQYDIATDSWSFMAKPPANVKEGGALIMGGSAYQTSGTLTSATHDTTYAADFGSISWTETSPLGTEIRFQVATNNDGATWDFKGPDGGSGSYYTASGTGIWTGHDGDRYIRYKAFFSTTDSSVTPVLHDISLTYTQQAPAVVPPTVTTANATLVEETAATLNGAVTDDGGEPCQYRFQYGTSPGVYSTNTTWTGSKTTGESFSIPVTGLTEGTKYYFRAQAKNSAGTGDGAELSLLTKPLEPMSFVASAGGGTQINLSWTKGDGAQRTMVRRQTGTYPATIYDGEEVYFDTGTAYSDSGLSPNTEYYYSAWSEVTGSQQWSDAAAAVIATTGEGSTEPPIAVGGTIFPVDKGQVMDPIYSILMAVSLALAIGGCGVVLFIGRDGASRHRAR
jgi:hypothetical protein